MTRIELRKQVVLPNTDQGFTPGPMCRPGQTMFRCMLFVGEDGEDGSLWTCPLAKNMGIAAHIMGNLEWRWE